MADKPEVWLRGALPGIPALLQPVAHALLQAREEVDSLMNDFPSDLLWEKPAGLASPGFHLQHLTGVLDRLFVYAKGGQLDVQQLDYLKTEGNPGGQKIAAVDLIELFNRQVDKAIAQLKVTNVSTLTEARGVGRAQWPSTVIGLYVHAAEHTMRHVGQLLATAKMLKAGIGS